MKKIFHVIFTLLLSASAVSAQWQETSLRTTVNSTSGISTLYYDGNILWAGSLSRVFKSENKGETWTETTSGGINVLQTNVQAIIRLDDYVYVAFGGNGNKQIYRTNDEGKTWELDMDGYSQSQHVTHFYTHKEFVVAKLETNNVLYKKNSDTEWSKLDVQDSRFNTPVTIFSRGDSLVLTSGQNGPAIALTDDMGETWTYRTVDWGNDLPSNGDWMSNVWHGKHDKSQMYGVHRGFTTTPRLAYVYSFVKSGDAMNSFGVVTGHESYGSTLNTMWISDNDVYMAFSKSVVIRSTDGGQTWIDLSNNILSFVQYTHLPVTAMEVIDGRLFVAGNQNGVLVYESEVTSMADLSYGNSISFYPSPASEIVTVENLPAGSDLSILDISGNEVYNTTTSDSNITINISGLDNGLYILRAGNKDNITSRKLIINR